MARSLSVPEQHQLRIARQTLRMSDSMARVMGGMTKEEARAIIRRLTGKRASNPDRPVYDKGEVNYREASACGNCLHFRFLFPVTTHGSCDIVKGKIQPEMVCDMYEPDEE